MLVVLDKPDKPEHLCKRPCETDPRETTSGVYKRQKTGLRSVANAPTTSTTKMCPLQDDDDDNDATLSRASGQFDTRNAGNETKLIKTTDAMEESKEETKETIIVPLPVLAHGHDKCLDVSFDIEELKLVMKRQNDTHHPYPLYMDGQEHVDGSMRAVLVHWMMEVSAEFCCSRETLLMAVMCVDRFLSITSALDNRSDQADDDTSKLFIVDRGNLQLVGIACLVLCSKLEEKYPPKVKDWCISSDGAYNAKQIVAMEKKVLELLKWSFVHPTAVTWLGMYWQQAFGLIQSTCRVETTNETFAEKFNEMAQLIDAATCDVWFLRYYPYTIAASILVLETRHRKSRVLLSLQDILCITGFECDTLLPCMAMLYCIDTRLKRASIRSDKSAIMQTLAFPKHELCHRQNHNPDILSVLSQFDAKTYTESLGIKTVADFTKWQKDTDALIVQSSLSVPNATP